MISPLTYQDLGDFLQMVVYAFQAPIFMSFVLMLTFAICFQIKRLFVDGY